MVSKPASTQGETHDAYDSPYLSENWDLTVDALPPAYREDAGIYFKELQKIESSILARGDVPNSLVVIEVGCGGGRAMNALAQQVRNANNFKPRLEFIGVDPAQHMLDRAAHCPDIPLVATASWILGSSEDFVPKIAAQGPEKKTDLLFMAMGSVHHLIREGQLQDFLGNIARILQPVTGRACLGFMNKILQRDGMPPVPDPQSQLEVQSKQFPGVYYRTVFLEREEVDNVRETKYEILVFEKDETGREKAITAIPSSLKVRVWNETILLELFKAHGLDLVDLQRTEAETFYSLRLASA